MSGGGWNQLIAAVLAAVIPIVVKILNDWHDRVTAQPVSPATSTPSSPALYDQDNPPGSNYDSGSVPPPGTSAPGDRGADD